MASARTSDHHPSPMQATRRGLVRTTFPLRLAENAVCGLVSDQATRRLSPAHPDRLDSRLGDAQISLPVAAAHPDTANTLAVNQHRAPPSMAVHRSGPAASARPIAWLTSRS